MKHQWSLLRIFCSFLVLFCLSCAQKEDAPGFFHEAQNPLISSGKWSELHQACFDEDTTLVQLILAKKCNPNVQAPLAEDRNVTPLHLAAAKGNSTLCQILFSAKAQVNATDSIGNTPLHYAITTGNLDLVQKLVHWGADLQAQSWYVHTPLELAKELQSDEIIDFLQETLEQSPSRKE